MSAETSGSGLVRVRVRPGARIKLGSDRIALGGDWIELPEADLRIRSLRSSVETEQEISARKADRSVSDSKPSQADEHFSRLRNAARIQAEQTKASREDVERALAEQTLGHLAKDEQTKQDEQSGKKKR